MMAMWMMTYDDSDDDGNGDHDGNGNGGGFDDVDGGTCDNGRDDDWDDDRHGD